MYVGRLVWRKGVHVLVKAAKILEEREVFLRAIFKEMWRRKLEIFSTAPQYGRVSLQLSGGVEVTPTHFYVGKDPVVRAVAEFIGGAGPGEYTREFSLTGT